MISTQASESHGAACTFDTQATDEARRPASETLELSRPECLRLLSATNFGRIAVTGAHGPIIRPVNYVFDEPSQAVIFRTAPGSKLRALLTSGKAAFEVDGTDPPGGTGWSVIIFGATEEVTNKSELRRLETIGVDSWAPGSKERWVRIRANVVSGRRIMMAPPRPATEHDLHARLTS